MKAEVPTITYLLLLTVTLALISSYYLFVLQFEGVAQSSGEGGINALNSEAQRFLEQQQQNYYGTEVTGSSSSSSQQNLETTVSGSSQPSSVTSYIFAGTQNIY